MKNRKSEAPDLPLLFLSDILGFLISVVPALLPWAAALIWVIRSWEQGHAVAGLLVSPFILVGSFLIGIGVLRLLLPRMRSGVFSIGLNAGFAGWYSNLLLGRALDISGLAPVVHSFYTLKFLYWRIMGAKVPLRLNSSMRVSLSDFPMLSIGEDTTLSDGCHLLGHTFVGDKLLTFPVEIGKNVFVGGRSIIGPRSKIGDRVWIGVGNLIYGRKIEADAQIEDFSPNHQDEPS